MFEKKRKATKKNEDLMKKVPSSCAVELGDDVLVAAAGGYAVWQDLPLSFTRGAPRVWRLEGFRDGGGFVSIKFRSAEEAHAWAKDHGID